MTTSLKPWLKTDLGTRGRLRKPFLTVSTCLVLLAWGSPVHAGEDAVAEPVDPQSRLGEVFGYYLERGGVWRQDNASFETGSGQPVAYLKKYAWGPGKSLVLDDTWALMQDGSCTEWTHNVFNWDAENGRIHGQIFHRSGLWLTGHVSATGEHGLTAEFAGRAPDGSALKMRDRTDLSDRDKALVSPLFWDGEAWVEGPQVSWNRLQPGEAPCIDS